METQRIESYQYARYYEESLEPSYADYARRAAEEAAAQDLARERQAEEIAMYANYDGLGRYVNLLH